MRRCASTAPIGWKPPPSPLAIVTRSGDHALLLAGVQRAGAPHAAHHLVEDEQDAVAIADLAHGAEVPGHRGQHAGGRAAHGLRDERDHAIGAGRDDGRVELGGEAASVRLGRLAFAEVAVRIAGRDVRDVDQQRRELAPAPLVAAHRERTQRVAVVALPPCDEVRALRLPDLDEVLARHLERGLDRLRAAAHEVGVARAGGPGAHQLVGQRLGGLGREEARVRVGQAVDLLVDRGEHVGVPVAEAGHRGAAAGVEIAPALGVGQEHACAADGDGGLAVQVAMEDAGHGSIVGRCATARGRRRPDGTTPGRICRHEAGEARARVPEADERRGRLIPRASRR